MFLLSLVWCASLMPVERLPAPSWQTAFGLGVVSSVFDNIPLTALALRQDGYDWGFLAYAVGFGGSMIWFGPWPAGAPPNNFPRAGTPGCWARPACMWRSAMWLAFLCSLASPGWARERSGP